MLIQRPCCFFNIRSSCSSRPNQRRWHCLLLPPMAGCATAQAAMPYPTPLLARPFLYHPHLLLFSSDGSRTSKPSYSSSHGQPLPSLPRLRVVPFLVLAVVHRPGAFGAALSTWSRNDFHRTWTVVERLTAGSTAAARKCLLITHKKMNTPPASWDPPWCEADLWAY